MSASPEHKLQDIAYLKFPFRVGKNGGETSNRVEYIREKIEQIIFTIPGERIFRETFGGGVKRLVFEPNHKALVDFVTSQLQMSIEPSLQGEIDPLSLRIKVEASSENVSVLRIEISYLLAAIGFRDRFVVNVGISDG